MSLSLVALSKGKISQYVPGIRGPPSSPAGRYLCVLASIACVPPHAEVQKHKPCVFESFGASPKPRSKR